LACAAAPATRAGQAREQRERQRGSGHPATVPPYELARAVREGVRPRLDAQAGEVPAQVVAEGGGSRVASVRLPPQGFENDRVQIVFEQRRQFRALVGRQARLLQVCMAEGAARVFDGLALDRGGQLRGGRRRPRVRQGPVRSR
jgi:hypothetical protein